MFESLNKLVEAFFAGEFDPAQYKFFVRGSELFILDGDAETVFERYCGEIVLEICAIFGAEPVEI